jgi:hypothetical protein
VSNVFSTSFAPSTTERSFSVLVDAIAGERYFLGVRPSDGMNTTVTGLGVRLRVSEVISFPTHRDCDAVFRFDDPDPLRGACGAGTLEKRAARDGSEPGSGRSLAEDWMGQAMTFTDGTSAVATATSGDYSGDFTVELWAQVQFSNYFDNAIFADWSGPATGGVALYLQPRGDESAGMYAGYIFPSTGTNPPGADCDEVSCSIELRAPHPPSGNGASTGSCATPSKTRCGSASTASWWPRGPSTASST